MKKLGEDKYMKAGQRGNLKKHLILTLITSPSSEQHSLLCCRIFLFDEEGINLWMVGGKMDDLLSPLTSNHRQVLLILSFKLF